MSKANPSRHAPGEIDAYLQALPEATRAALEQMREIVHETAPGCTERVSYGIPIFRLRTDLVGMSGQRNHCSLHTMSPPLVQAMAAELKADGVEASGATVHFKPEKPLSRELIVRIVQERMKTASPAG